MLLFFAFVLFSFLVRALSDVYSRQKRMQKRMGCVVRLRCIMILPIMMAVVVVVMVVVVVVPIMMTYSFIGNLPVLYVHDLTTRFQLSFIETSALDSTNVEQVSTAAAAAAAASSSSKQQQQRRQQRRSSLIVLRHFRLSSPRFTVLSASVPSKEVQMLVEDNRNAVEYNRNAFARGSRRCWRQEGCALCR